MLHCLNAARTCRLAAPAPLSLLRRVRLEAFKAPIHHGQQVCRGPSVVCAAGLQIGKPYSSKDGLKPASSFEDMAIVPTLLEAIRAAGFTKPTEIQSLAVPAISKGGDTLLCSQTGSGKTLAYLLPIVHNLKSAETEEESYNRKPKRPKIVILGPTKELTDQITAVAKSLCHFAKFRAICCNANTSLADQCKKLGGPIDMVVATPTRLLQHQEAGNVALGDVQWLVIDEADTMFDQGFGEEVTNLLNIVKKKQQPAQIILVSATMTKAVKRLADAAIPDLRRIEASGFHKPTAGARQEFRVLPPGGDKLQMLLEVLQNDVRKERKVLVFCGSVGSCRAVEHACRDNELPVVCYHGDMPIQARKDSMAAFAGTVKESDADAPSIMVATDLAARGLDFPGTIDHVVNFDFPTNAIDYLHRCGRTARAGSKGLVTSLVGPRDRNLAKAVQYALDKGLPLDQVTASGAEKEQQPAASGETKWVRPKKQKREKAPTPVKGEVQQVRWDPNHKFIHVNPKDGQPYVPFKELLKGKGGDERKKLLYEIAMDVKEYRRWRHARAVAKSAKRRLRQQSKQAAEGQAQGARQRQYYSQAEPEEKWKRKIMSKRMKKAEDGPHWQGRGKQANKR